MTRIQDPGTSVRGWPRPRRQYEPDVEQHPDRTAAILPVPWVVGGDWLAFQPEAPTAEAERLCQVCGDRLGRVMVLCRGHRPRVTSGPGCHPRCAALAIQFCPHLVEMDDDADVAYRYEGASWLGYKRPRNTSIFSDEMPVSDRATPLTREQVREMAKTDPLGSGAR